mmetsp:Transcript_2330/g.5902  ORF Transcript_2330/g.5902 Transcript_2330/m.5902 type:complete len:239 (+) Transcript_2330:731-1447(+)
MGPLVAAPFGAAFPLASAFPLALAFPFAAGLGASIGTSSSMPFKNLLPGALLSVTSSVSCSARYAPSSAHKLPSGWKKIAMFIFNSFSTSFVCNAATDRSAKACNSLFKLACWLLAMGASKFSEVTSATHALRKPLISVDGSFAAESVVSLSKSFNAGPAVSCITCLRGPLSCTHLHNFVVDHFAVATRGWWVASISKARVSGRKGFVPATVAATVYRSSKLLRKAAALTGRSFAGIA